MIGAAVTGMVVEKIIDVTVEKLTGMPAEKAIGVAIEKVAEKVSEKSTAFFDKLESAADVDKPEIVKKEESVKAFWDSLEGDEGDYPSGYKERIERTPLDGNTERGYWEGERGESKYIPSEEAKYMPTDKNIKETLGKFGLDGIVYKDGIPDFSACSASTVEIEDMTESRTRNFEQAGQKCADQWNEEGRYGKTDWTARDIADFRRYTGYSWHECNDRKTCQLVPTEINGYFTHLGGVSECKKANAREDVFDE